MYEIERILTILFSRLFLNSQFRKIFTDNFDSFVTLIRENSWLIFGAFVVIGGLVLYGSGAARFVAERWKELREINLDDICKFSKYIIFIFFGLSALMAYGLVFIPALKGKQSFWIVSETLIEFKRQGFLSALIIFYLYVVFYASVILMAGWIISKIQTRHLYPSSDPYYSDIRIEHIALYQHYFNQIIKNIDLKNCQNWLLDLSGSGQECNHNSDQLDKDIQYLVGVLDKADSEYLKARYLLIMVVQYIFDEFDLVAEDTSSWVKRVLRHKPDDCFTTAQSRAYLLPKIEEYYNPRNFELMS